MKGCVQMFLSIKKLTIKITAVVATVLLITGATFGIKKCCNKTPKRVAPKTVTVETNPIVEEPSNEVNDSTHAFRNVGALNHNQEADEVNNSTHASLDLKLLQKLQKAAEVNNSTHVPRGYQAVLNLLNADTEVINSVDISHNRRALNPTQKDDDTVTIPTDDTHAETSSSESESYHNNSQD